MNKFYGRYKNVRGAAWQFLIDFGLASLPVDIADICKQMEVAVYSYESGKSLLETLKLTDHCNSNDAFALCFMDKWFVFYRDHFYSYAQINYVLAHEIGHILLGHKLKTKRDLFQKCSFVQKKDAIEKEADMFASRILAPACILKELGIQSYTEIMTLCYLPKEPALQRAQRLKELIRRNRFYEDPLECSVRDRFMGFLDRMKNSSVGVEG